VQLFRAAKRQQAAIDVIPGPFDFAQGKRRGERVAMSGAEASK